MTMPTKKTYLVISALGEDRPGIVNRLSKVLLDQGCNIEDSRMAVLGGEFAAMLLVEGKWNTLAKVENVLPELERQLGMTIISKRTGERVTGKNLLPYGVDVIAMDHPGIVNNLAEFFAERDINIEDMSTSTYAAMIFVDLCRSRDYPANDPGRDNRSTAATSCSSTTASPAGVGDYLVPCQAGLLGQ